MFLLRPTVFVLLLASCHGAAATVPRAWALADPAPLLGMWQIQLWPGSDIPLYENTPFNTRQPPWLSGALIFADSSLNIGIRGDTIHGVARFMLRTRPGGTNAELPDYPAVAVLGTDGRVSLRVDLAPQCSEGSCLRLLEFSGTLSADRMRGDWTYGNNEVSTNGPGVAYRDRPRGR